jgi:hypothetical protein
LLRVGPMFHRGWIVVAALATGCYTTRTVATAELPRLHQPVAGDGMAVRTTSSSRARLGPRSWLRLRNHQGEWTDWLRGQDVRVDGDGIWIARRDGVWAPQLVGWPWHEVATAEVQNMSVTQLAAAAGAGAGLGLLLAPFAVAGVYTSAMRGYDGPPAGEAPSSEPTWREAALAASEHDPLRPPGDWAASPAGPASRHAPHLFSASVRRRSLVSVTAAASVDVDASRGALVLEGGSAGVRLWNAIELGAGGLHLARRTAGRWDSTFVAFGRGGLVLPLDAGRRVKLPLTLDVGAGGHGVGRYVALRWGLRVRLPDHWYLGIQPLTGTWVSWDPRGRFAGQPRWTMTSGLELGRSF